MENRFGTWTDNDPALGSLFNERIKEPGNELILEHNDHIADTDLHVTVEKQAGWDNLKTFQTAGGTGTAITLTGVELVDGFQTTFIITNSNSGSATTINSKPLYKPGTTTAPKLIAGKAATVWYNSAGGCFFIKASAEGTAVAGDVLAGKTFSNDDDTGLTGTLALTGDAVAADVYSGKEFYKDDAKTKLTGTNPYKAGVKVPFFKLTGGSPMPIVSRDMTYSTFNERMSIAYVTDEGYSYLPLYNGSTIYYCYDKYGVLKGTLSISTAAVYGLLEYNGYLYIVTSNQIVKYSITNDHGTFTQISAYSLPDSFYGGFNSLKRIGGYIFIRASSNIYRYNISTDGFDVTISPGNGLQSISDYGSSYILVQGTVDLRVYTLAGGLVRTITPPTISGVFFNNFSVAFSQNRNSFIWIGYIDISPYRHAVILEYSVSGSLLNTIDLYATKGITIGGSSYPRIYGVSNGGIFVSLDNAVNSFAVLKESDLSYLGKFAGIDTSYDKVVLNGDFMTQVSGNVHMAFSLAATLS